MRTYEQAKAFALRQHQDPTHGWYRKCQVFSRQCVGADAFGGSARLAFNGTPAEHKHTSKPPPPGSIAYYGLEHSGTGHAVFVVEGGHVWSSDIKRHGRIDRVKWDVFNSVWPSHPYRGWIDHCPDGELPVQDPVVSLHHPHFRQAKRVYRSKMRFHQTDSDSVWNLQVALMGKHFPFKEGPTSSYGTHTRDACAAFQMQQHWRGADANGIAGPETIRRLGLVWVDE